MPVYFIDLLKLLQIIAGFCRTFLITNFARKPALLFGKFSVAFTVELMVSTFINLCARHGPRIESIRPGLPHYTVCRTVPVLPPSGAGNCLA